MYSLQMNDANSLLLSASLRGDAEAVKACLTTRCVNINHSTSDGNTALTIAACWGHTAVAEVLIGAGADLFKGPVSTSMFYFLSHSHDLSLSILIPITYHTIQYHYPLRTGKCFSFLTPDLVFSLTIFLPQKGDFYGTKTPLYLARNRVSYDSYGL